MINNQALKEELKSVLDKYLIGELLSKQLDVLNRSKKNTIPHLKNCYAILGGG